MHRMLDGEMIVENWKIMIENDDDDSMIDLVDVVFHFDDHHFSHVWSVYDFHGYSLEE